MSSLLDTRRPRLLLTLFCLLLWTPGFFTIPPGDRDESRFVQATKQMLETGDLIRIQNGAEARNRKPIGIHWLQVPFAAAAQRLGLATGNPVWPYRIPSALGGLLAVLAVFWAGQSLMGQRAALLAAGMLAASVVLVTEVHIAKTDAALLGATTVAMGALAQAYMTPSLLRHRDAALFWLAMGAGVLLKGPITPMVAGLTVLTLVAADRRAGWLRALHPAWGIPLMLAVVLPWFVAIGVATGGQFFNDAVGGDLGRKLASGDDQHWGPPGLHLLLLPVLLFPLSGLLPGAALAAWRGRMAAPERFLLAWIVPAWLVFEAVPTKLPHYTLPLYPAICLLAAGWLLDPARAALPRWGRRLSAALPLVGALVLGGAALALPVVLGMPLWLGVPAAVAAVVVGWAALLPFPPGSNRETVYGRGEGVFAAARATVGASVLQLLGRSASRPPHPNPLPGGEGAVAALAASVVLYATILGFELPRLAPLWIAPRVVAALPDHGTLGAVGYSEPSLMFLAGTDTQWLLAADAPAALASRRIRTLLVGDRDRAAVLAGAEQAGVRLQAVADVPGFNYSRGRRVDLTIYRLAP